MGGGIASIGYLFGVSNKPSYWVPSLQDMNFLLVLVSYNWDYYCFRLNTSLLLLLFNRKLCFQVLVCFDVWYFVFWYLISYLYFELIKWCYWKNIILYFILMTYQTHRNEKIIPEFNFHVLPNTHMEIPKSIPFHIGLERKINPFTILTFLSSKRGIGSDMQNSSPTK